MNFNTFKLRLTALASALSLYLTPAQSVDSITASLEATLGKLETAKERHDAAAAADEAKAVVLIRSAIKKRAEAGRAARVAGRLGDLLS